MINTKQESVLKSIKDGFEVEDMGTQYSVLSYWTYLHFHDYKLAIEADELGHNDRNIDREIQREKKIQKELGCEFIRINPDEQNFDTFKAINKIHRHI